MILEKQVSQIAVFFDYDNQKVEPRIIFDFVENFGWIVKKRAYGDWVRDSLYRADMAAYAVELVDRPRFTLSDHKGNDIAITVDAMEIIFTRPNINVIVLITGDADFVPLVLKLKEYGKYVIIISSHKNTSSILAKVCDQFVIYESLVKNEEPPPLDHNDYYTLIIRKAYNILKNRGMTPTVNNLLAIVRHFDPTFDLEKTDFKSFEELVKAANVPLNEISNTNKTTDKSTETKTQVAAKTSQNKKDSVAVSNKNDSVNDKKQAETEDKSIPTLVNIFTQIFEVNELADSGIELTKLKSLFSQTYPTFNFKKYNVESFLGLIYELCKNDRFILNGKIVSYSKKYKIERGLRKMGIYIAPSLKHSLIESFLEVYKNYSDESTRTLNNLARELYNQNKNKFSKSIIANIFTALKFTGIFEGIDASSYITYSQPIRINCPLEEIEHKLNLFYLKRIIKITNVNQNDFIMLSSFIFDDSCKVDDIQGMIDELIKMNEILKVNSEYVYNKENS